MIHSYVSFAILITFSVLLLVMLGQRLKIAYPIFLVIAGLAISFIPALPSFQVNPDWVFLIFLPPILFEASWYTSWNDFWKWKRPIFLLAIGLVLLTSFVIAFVAQSLIPGMTLALGFVLGGIISPPDTAAATSVLKHFKIPKRVNTILEGESLVNDATSLIVFKFALAAVVSSQFVFQQAVIDFFIVGGMGVLLGAFLGWLFTWLIRWLPTNSNIDTILTLIIPYVLYITAEYFHFSGVIAVVSGGLTMSYKSNRFLSFAARLQAGSVWSTVIFMLNALIFILIGLQLPVVEAGLEQHTIADGIRYAVMISVVMILVRFAWTYIIAYLPQIIYKKAPRPDTLDWRTSFVISLAGMRGVVSLASALAIPLLLPSGEAFPHRNILLFVTFVIILITLVGQGFLLPLLLRFIKLKEEDVQPEEEQEAIIIGRIKKKAVQVLKDDFPNEVEQNLVVRNMKLRLETDLDLLTDKMHCFKNIELHKEKITESREIYKRIIDEQRKELQTLKNENQFQDAVLRRIEMQLDLEEAKMVGLHQG